MAYRRHKNENYVHLVWTTHGRQPLITEAIERDLYRCISSQASEMDCEVLALNGMPDHVHLVLTMTRKVALSELAKRIKGVSSALANDLLRHERLFRWQESYAVFSVSRRDLSAVIAYVCSQKQHHADKHLTQEWEEWEEVDEAVAEADEAVA